MDKSNDNLRYPIGTFAAPDLVTLEQVQTWTADLERLPADLRAVVTRLDDAQLDTPYRPGGWTVRQVVHHVPDSHLSSLIRFKWALTEDRLPSNRTTSGRGPPYPTITQYQLATRWTCSTPCTGAGSVSFGA